LKKGVAVYAKVCLEPVINFFEELNVQRKYIPALSSGWLRNPDLILQMSATRSGSFALPSYLKKPHAGLKTAKNIHTATLDEIESLLGLSRQLAKEFIKLRVEKGTVTPDDILSIKGIKPAVAKKAQEVFSFEPSPKKQA
jgi:DNA uptake protein ComE-like DNA-binding protein